MNQILKSLAFRTRFLHEKSRFQCFGMKKKVPHGSRTQPTKRAEILTFTHQSFPTTANGTTLVPRGRNDEQFFYFLRPNFSSQKSWSAGSLSCTHCFFFYCHPNPTHIDVRSCLFLKIVFVFRSQGSKTHVTQKHDDSYGQPNPTSIDSHNMETADAHGVHGGPSKSTSRCVELFVTCLSLSVVAVEVV